MRKKWPPQSRGGYSLWLGAPVLPGAAAHPASVLLSGHIGPARGWGGFVLHPAGRAVELFLKRY